MQPPAFSICVVARNAEDTHERLFNSLREFSARGGDMVLVDTGSTDRTTALYREFGFRVFKEGSRFNIAIPSDVAEQVNRTAAENGDPPIIPDGTAVFNFSEARNYAASLAANDCIINPDADEALTVFDIERVESAFGRFSRFSYEFVFDHHPDGSPNLQWIADTRCSNRKHWRWCGLVHETNEPLCGMSVMGYVPPDVLRIEHWQVESVSRSSYLPALAYACHIAPKDHRSSHYFGRELLRSGFNQSAMVELSRCLAISPRAEERSLSMVFIGDACQCLGRDSAALDWYGRAFAEYGGRREPLMRLADYWYRKGMSASALDGEPQRALAYCAAALEIEDDGFYGNSPSYYKERPAEIWTWAQSELKKGK